MTPLTVAEARAILVADETLHLAYEARLASGNTLGSEERAAWARLVESANDRIAAFAGQRTKSRQHASSVDDEQRVLVHADGGDCHGTVLIDGRCPKCGIVPDMQSREFWPGKAAKR